MLLRPIKLVSNWDANSKEKSMAYLEHRESVDHKSIIHIKQASNSPEMSFSMPGGIDGEPSKNQN